SMVMGRNSKAINSYNFAGGLFAQATGFYSFAYGDSPRATGTYTYAFGWQPFASGTGSMAHGWQNRATGDWAVSWGRQTVSKPYLSFVIGQFNDTTSASSTSWVNTDPLFIAGNGTSNNNRSNALTLYKNGNMTIAGTLTQNSDARLKRNIQPISDALEKLRQLNGYHYQWNTPYADDHEIKSGLLAQEIEKVMPELVRSDGNGVLSVDYSGLIPYLLEGIKTLEEEVEQLKNP